MTRLRPWAKLPNWWIEAGRLAEFRWGDGGSDALAALMILVVAVHHADDAGVATLTYPDLGDMASLSRERVAAGLARLAAAGLLTRAPRGRSALGLARWTESRWAKLPARGMYRNGVVGLFDDFRLRSRTELDAVKLLLLLASRREQASNLAKISFDKIEAYSGIPRDQIRRALSMLAAHGLVHTDRVRSSAFENGVASAYRLAHIDPYRHAGTMGDGSTAPREVDLDTEF